MSKRESSENRAKDCWRALKRLGVWEESPWLPFWKRGRNGREREVARLRRVALGLLRARSGESAGWTAARALAWPGVLAAKAWLAARDPELPGFGGRWALGVWDLAAHNLRPKALRPLRATRPGDDGLTGLFVPDRENQALMVELIRGVADAEIGDKVCFDGFCRRHGLAHIALLAHGRGAVVEHAEAVWPEGDVFAKSAGLWGGQGAEALVFDGAGAWRDRLGRRLEREAPGEWAGSVYGEGRWLLQAMLRADSAWAAWSPGPVGTVRLTTVIVEPGGEPEVVAASMRLPRAGMVVDNFSAGALSAEIDAKTGRLGPALGHRGARRWHDVHPDTGGAITGAVVPDWPAYLALARAAHEAAPGLAAVGWDLTCRAGRPVLIEANPVFNIAPTVVLGETRWLEAMSRRFPAVKIS